MINHEHSTTHAFCETIAASITHIRILGPKGRMPGGGADTTALCGALVLWDTGLAFSSERVATWRPWPYRLCSQCKTEFTREQT